MGEMLLDAERSGSRRPIASADIHRVYYALVMAVACVFAQPAVAAPPTPVEEPGIELLQKVQSAARKLDYSGVYTYQQGATMVSSRIVHVVDGTGERERIEILDGAPREYVRHNETTQCLIPDRKLVVLERRRGDRFPALLLGAGETIPSHYAISTFPDVHRIAGRECTVIELTPKDDHRYGYRLCADTRTNLLLKVQTLDPANAIVDQVTFTNLQVGDKVAPEDLVSRWNIRDWKVVEADLVPVDLSAAGWRIPFPPGFRIMSQVSRPMQSQREVSQLLISDGLAAISIFIEAFKAPRDQPLSRGAMHKGAMNVFRTRIGDYWLTALGEVPAATLQSIAEHTEYVPLAEH
ncbi:MAG TPA: MucB/RseB C-terminal domain-containing protein [Candidimonas sp.]|nr:MucB/RseB C-terminal domain-containing protein [Candidimonas sp.]